MSPIVAHRADANLSPLPKVIISDFRNGDIESMPNPIDQLSNHVTFPLQGMIFWNAKVELANSNHHFRSHKPIQRKDPSMGQDLSWKPLLKGLS
jgi:hypothetical protein